MIKCILCFLILLNTAYLVSAQTRMVQVGEDSLQMNWIKPGEFYMGSSQEEKDWAINEGRCKKEEIDRVVYPVRLATIKDGFWMGIYEVTFGQFDAFIKQTKYKSDGEKDGKIYTYSSDLNKWTFVENRSWKDPNFGFPMQNNYPVVSVSWYDAIAFCKWLTEIEKKAGNLPEGYEYRLPTEAEWEYACRGGCEKTKFWWGDDIADAKGRINASGPDTINVKTNVLCPARGITFKDGFAFTAPVGHFGERGQNGFDLSDMSGNVHEWTMDKYDEKGASENVCTTGENKMHIIKGGAFTSPPGFYLIAYRSPWDANISCGQVGFRVVLGKQL